MSLKGCFFFSSRRRHTRCGRDWSSDVCSSDIGAVFERQIRRLDAPTRAALDLAAVLGRRLADLSLYDVVDLSAAAAGEALSRLRDEGLLREVHGGLEFRNELIRAQGYYAVPGPARERPQRHKIGR